MLLAIVDQLTNIVPLHLAFPSKQGCEKVLEVKISNKKKQFIVSYFLPVQKIQLLKQPIVKIN